MSAPERPVLEWRSTGRRDDQSATVGVFELVVEGGSAPPPRWWWSVYPRDGGDLMRHGSEPTLLASQLAAEDAAREAGIAVPSNPPKNSDGCPLLSAAKQMIKAMQPICYQKWPHRVDAFNALRAAVEAAEATDAV